MIDMVDTIVIPIIVAPADESKNGWGKVQIADTYHHVYDILNGLEGREKAPEIRPLVLLLREYKKISVDTEEYKQRMSEALLAFEQHKRSVMNMQTYMNSFEQAIEKLATPELLQMIEDAKK
jgi:hypothetical protein